MTEYRVAVIDDAVTIEIWAVIAARQRFDKPRGAIGRRCLAAHPGHNNWAAQANKLSRTYAALLEALNLFRPVRACGRIRLEKNRRKTSGVTTL